MLDAHFLNSSKVSCLLNSRVMLGELLSCNAGCLPCLSVVLIYGIVIINVLLKVLTFPTNCPSCNAPCETNMKLIGR